MLKALKFLKDQRRRHINMAKSMKVVYFDDELDEAIAELEALNNRSCENCKHHIDTSKLSDEEYLSLIGKCIRCKYYYNDNWELK